MKCQFKGHNNVELRIMKCYDKDVFVDKLRSLDWAKVTSVKKRQGFMENSSRKVSTNTRQCCTGNFV